MAHGMIRRAVDWAVFKNELKAHIHNGAARDLYPQSLADDIITEFEQRMFTLRKQLEDAKV